MSSKSRVITACLTALALACFSIAVSCNYSADSDGGGGAAGGDGGSTGGGSSPFATGTGSGSSGPSPFATGSSGGSGGASPFKSSASGSNGGGTASGGGGGTTAGEDATDRPSDDAAISISDTQVGGDRSDTGVVVEQDAGTDRSADVFDFPDGR